MEVAYTVIMSLNMSTKVILKEDKINKSEAALDTLAQLVTSDEKGGENFALDEDIKFDSVTSLDDRAVLKKRARRKYLSTGLTLSLVTASEQNVRSSLTKSYWNTYHCSSILSITAKGKIKGEYCKNRWCLVCSSIRTARLIKQYQPIIKTWEDKYFVTLTVPNCKGLDLKNTLEYMAYYATQVRKNLNQSFKRGYLDRKFLGIRKLECTYNSIRDDYHPHYHFIINGHDNAQYLLDNWLLKLKYAVRSAQDIRPADNESVMELFKYFTKVISKSKSKKSIKEGVKGNSVIFADAQDIIFNAVKRKRVFQPFGFKLGDVGEAVTDDDLEIDEVVAVAEWDQDFKDWFRKDTGEDLTGHTPSDGFIDLVENKIIVRKGYTGC